MKTIATVFSGFGGVECGAIAAGLQPIWAIENNMRVAKVHQDNFGCPVICEDARIVDPKRLEPPDVLWASPPCQQWSRGRDNVNLHTRKDAEVGACIPGYIRTLRPKVFILENVIGYRKSCSYQAIRNELDRHGYFSCAQHLDAADFGVPSHRRRLILIAVRDGLIRPLHTHTKTTWFQAVRDIVGDCEDIDWANWQKESIDRVPDGDILVSGAKSSYREICGPQIYPSNRCAFTLTSSQSRNAIRARIDQQVKRLSFRAIARLQSFPDSFRLPKASKAAFGRGVGNAVPPLFAQRILEAVA